MANNSRQSSFVSRQPKRRKPLGVVVPLTTTEIAALALITPEDIEHAKSEAIPELRDLLDAQPLKRKVKRHAKPKRSPESTDAQISL